MYVAIGQHTCLNEAARHKVKYFPRLKLTWCWKIYFNMYSALNPSVIIQLKNSPYQNLIIKPIFPWCKLPTPTSSSTSTVITSKRVVLLFLLTRCTESLPTHWVLVYILQFKMTQGTGWWENCGEASRRLILPSAQSFFVSLLLTTNGTTPMQTREGPTVLFNPEGICKRWSLFLRKKKESYEEISPRYELLSWFKHTRDAWGWSEEFWGGRWEWNHSTE